MSRVRGRATVALLVATAMFASACSRPASDVADTGAGPTSSPPPDPEADDDPTVDDGQPGEDATTLDDLERLWADRRAAVVDRIVDGGYGVDDDGILRGPGGLTVDLDGCPVDWWDRAGVTDTIQLGFTFPLSGTLADFGPILRGIEAYLELVNERHGGVGGRPIELEVLDDSYVNAATIRHITDLIANGESLAVTTFGSPNGIAVLDIVAENCMPHTFAIGGHPALGDPDRPWTTSLGLSHSTEAVLWGRWLEDTFVERLPVRVTAIVMDNEFGHTYADVFGAWAEANPDVVERFSPVLHDPASPSLAVEMEVVSAASGDVFIAMTAGNPCLLVLQEADRLDLGDETIRVLPSHCRAPEVYLDPAGDAADGWHLLGGGGRRPIDWWSYNDGEADGSRDDPFLQIVDAELATRDLDPGQGPYGLGFGFHGWAQVEALRIADALPGGLSRTNLLIALHALDLEHPYLVDGVRVRTDGVDDRYPIEASDVLRYDARNQRWRRVGAIVDAEGSTPPCRWDGQRC